jgi:hypothetical protein
MENLTWLDMKKATFEGGQSSEISVISTWWGEVGERISFDSQAIVESEGKKAPIDGQGTISGAALTRKQRDGGAR